MHSIMMVRGDGFAPFRRVIVLGLAAFGLTLADGAAAAEPSASARAEIATGYGKLPLAFEANRGQTDGKVQYLVRGRGYALFLTADGAVLSLAKPRAAAEPAGTSTPAPSVPAMEGAVLAMQFPGANPQPRVTGRDAQEGHVNYLRGNDPAQWRTEVPTYAKVAYEGLYPGIDLVYYGNQGQLEYDFVVAPGADPNAVRLAFRGADAVAIDDAGELVLSTGGGEVRMHAPVLYQEEAGVRTPVTGGYVLNAAQEVGFTVAAYDPARPLIIDPVLAYSTYLGGSGLDYSIAIAVDLVGNAYVTGATTSSDFPTVGALQSTLRVADVFVSKLDRTGSRLLYSTYLGGSDLDEGLGIAVDLLGNAYVTGGTWSFDFPTVNALQSYAGGSDVFVAKLDRTGSRLLSSTYLGGSNYEEGRGIAVDLLGNAYVAGDTLSTDFPTVNPIQASAAGDRDVFVAKLDRNGGRLLYSTYLGGSNYEEGRGIAIDVLGNAFVTGITASSNFPAVNAVQSSLSGGSDAFVAKLDRNGRRLLSSTYLGGSDFEWGLAIAVDLLGNAYVTGNTWSADFPTLNAVQANLGGSTDAFVTKFDSSGKRLLYSTYLGGSDADEGFRIAVDLLGNAYVIGNVHSYDFPTVNPAQTSPGGNWDAYVAKLDRNGSRLLYSTYLGGDNDDIAGGIAVDARGNAYVTGFSNYSDFPTTAGSLQPAHAGGDVDGFVAKLAQP